MNKTFFLFLSAFMLLITIQGASAAYRPLYVELGNGTEYNASGVWDWNGLTHAWLMNNATDRVASNASLTFTGTTATSPAVFDGARNFSGGTTTDYASIGSLPINSTAWTMLFHTIPKAGIGSQISNVFYVQGDGASDRSMVLHAYATNDFYMEYTSAAGGSWPSYHQVDNMPWVAGQPNDVVVTRSGAKAYIYHNASNQTVIDSSTTSTAFRTPTVGGKIGGGPAYKDFNGTIDNVWLLNRVLNQTEITSWTKNRRAEAGYGDVIVSGTALIIDTSNIPSGMPFMINGSAGFVGGGGGYRQYVWGESNQGTLYLFNYDTTTYNLSDSTPSTPQPTWVDPTPASGTANNTQVTLNASCAVGDRVFMWFDSVNPPIANVLSNTTTGNYTTSVGVSGTYYYVAACYNNMTGIGSNTSVRTWIYDIIAPNIVLNPGNEFNTNNFSLLNQYDDWLNLSINFTDNNDLYAMEVNITRDGTIYYNLTNESLSGTVYNFTTAVNVTSWPTGRYTVYLAVADSHTAQSISDYQVTRKKSSVTFKPGNDNNIKIETREASTITTEKLLDRYTFRMVFDDGLTKARTFDVKTDKCPLTYKASSGYKGHFVSACGLEGNWIDFEGVAGTPTVQRIDDYHYTVSFGAVPADVTFKSIGGLNVLNTTYSWYRGDYSETIPYATVGDTFTHKLNVTNDTSLTLAASFLFNGTFKTVTSTSGSNWTEFSADIVNNGSGTAAYVWIVNVTQTDANVSQFNVTGTQTVNEWQVDDCTSFTSRRIRWNQYNEETPADALNGTFQLYIEYWTVSPENKKTYNHTYASSTYFELCASPANLTLYMDIYAQNTVPTGFTHRFYVQNGTFTGNIWTNYSIYNFNTTTGISALRVTARNNSNYNYYLNVLAYLQRRYVGEGVWRTVQMDRSGDYGLLYFNIKEANTDYRLYYLDSENNILLETEPIKFSCTSSVCDITQLLSEYSTTESATNVTATYSYNNVTKILTINWSGPLTATNTVDLKVSKETASGSTSLCTDTQVGSSGTLACNLTMYNGQFFIEAETASETLLATWTDITSARIGDSISLGDQSIWSFGIYATVLMAGLFSPAGVVIMSGVGVFLLWVFGILNPLSLTILLILVPVSIFIAFKVKQ